ncbi:MAG: glycosyltransferase [Flavobacteriaceae bacterium]|nr:glycosyltransferase [Flavobacteriaceae bacterium]
MKILLLIDSLVAGGRERRLIELIKGLRKYPEIHLNLVVFSDIIHFQEIYELDIHVHILKRVPKRNPLVFYKLFKICRSWKPDLMHSWATMSTIWAIPTSILLNVKLINGNITDAPKNMKFFDSRLFRARLTFPFSKVVVSNSYAGLKAYKVPKHKGICIINGFDMQRISDLKEKELVRKELRIQSPYVIGMVGSFSERKDYDTYLNAALKILELRNDVSFIAVGDGPKLEASKFIIPSEYTKYCIFTGAQKDVESIINIFTIGVLSTNTEEHGEGISNAILEYMALGKPTVASLGGGTNEIVVDLKTGFLIPSFSPELMADKLMYLLDNPEMRMKMGREGRIRVEETFSLTNMTKTYYHLYQKLLD